MIIPIRNLKIVNRIYKTSFTHLSAEKGFKSISCLHQQQINKFLISKNNANNKLCRPVKTNLEQCLQSRGFANFSPKPAESEDNLRKKSGNENNEEDKDQLPNHGHGDGRTLPRLMNFPEIMWPSLLNSIKNWIMVQFIIRPYMDREFNIRDFCQGAKKAMQYASFRLFGGLGKSRRLQRGIGSLYSEEFSIFFKQIPKRGRLYVLTVVSSKLMNGDFTNLSNLVTTEALTELKPVVQKLSVSQRRQLEVQESDIYMTFPYQVGILFDETNENVQKRSVEITMVFHVLRGLQEMRESGEEIPWNMGTLPEYQDKVFVCNYRFIKEFTNGKESDWTINVVNHFKPIDLLNELKKE